MMGIVGILVVVMLTLLARMRVLWRVVDIVVRPDSVVARQRVDAWGPPERTALAGCRNLYGKNLLGGSPAGLLRKRSWLWVMASGVWVLYVVRWYETKKFSYVQKL